MNKDPFKEYIKESEPAKRDKGYAWRTAIGLQSVDGLKTSEYLEVFLRNLLLNENHPLHIRALHISGFYKETEKPDIEEIKPDIETTKPDIEETKADIKTAKPDIEKIRPNIDEAKSDMQKKFSPKTAGHILRLRKEFPDLEIFGRADVIKVIDIKPSRASELLSDLTKHGIIETVSGHGKGKYRFRQREVEAPDPR